jgi:wyosine [tRNA(Phe)-imidazoG37] synthetase (radical SAM superfamily)
VPMDGVLDEMKAGVRVRARRGCITAAGSGEPTLHARIFGRVLTNARDVLHHLRYLLTNGTLLHFEECFYAGLGPQEIVKGRCFVRRHG